MARSVLNSISAMTFFVAALLACDARPSVAEDFPVAAGSWGGIVRSGPGQSYDKQDSLAEGDDVSLMGKSDEIFNGYPWFKIWYGPDQKKGYMWGGILCAKGTPRNDVFQMCPDQKSEGQDEVTGRVPVMGKALACNDDSNLAEKTICGTAKLTALDSEMNGEFEMRVENITSEANGGTEADVVEFRNEQKVWLKQRNACGDDLGCLEAQYQARLKVLRELNEPE